jgi:thiamine pyrophosphate-dependent acetolactate synthase large subunit-like protein
MVALSMADGYARLTNKPQCVIVHVDVGTQGLGAAVHNASCGRAPVLIFAGLSPFTIEGEMRGSRMCRTKNKLYLSIADTLEK